jgi:hypothetical protein
MAGITTSVSAVDVTMPPAIGAAMDPCRAMELTPG